MTTQQLASHLAGFPAWIPEIHNVYRAASSGDTDATRFRIREALSNPRLAKSPVGGWMRQWQRNDRNQAKAA